MLEAASVQPKI